MYEQPKTSLTGRIVWFILSVLIIGGVIWLALWFFFWRTPSVGTEKTSSGKSQSTQQSSNSPSTKNSSSTPTGQSTGSGSSSTTPTSLGQVVEETSPGTGANPATASATTLVNTGPGDIVTPIILVTAAGVVYYQIRLRRRFVPEAQ